MSTHYMFNTLHDKPAAPHTTLQYIPVKHVILHLNELGAFLSAPRL